LVFITTEIRLCFQLAFVINSEKNQTDFGLNKIVVLKVIHASKMINYYLFACICLISQQSFEKKNEAAKEIKAQHTAIYRFHCIMIFF